MMTAEQLEAALFDERIKIANAHIRLRELMCQHCPGPHVYRQHRDSQPPWCHGCGRTAAGRLVSPSVPR
jgi:NAD-dependent SIR2 family protein deacetylase